MKESLQKMTLAVALAVALLCGTVLQHHHHDADGSMCLAVSCHDCISHDNHGAGACHGHDCPGHDCEDGCGMHLDSFCCEQHDYAAFLPGSDLMLCDALINGLAAPERLMCAPVKYVRPSARAVIPGFRSARGLRAPPADNLC